MAELEFETHAPRARFLDLTPLIDMVFLLLVFFLLTSLSARPSISLELPEAETAVLEEPRDISLMVERGGAVRVNGSPVPMEALYGRLKEALAADPSREVSLGSDREVPFGHVVQAMDIARKAGARQLAIMTEHKP